MIRAAIGFLMVWAAVGAAHYFLTNSTKKERKPVWKAMRFGLITAAITAVSVAAFVFAF